MRMLIGKPRDAVMVLNRYQFVAMSESPITEEPSLW